MQEKLHSLFDFSFKILIISIMFFAHIFSKCETGVTLQSLKKGKKTHRSPSEFTLRCVYRRTVVQINLDCGANFALSHALIFPFISAARGRCRRPRDGANA